MRFNFDAAFELGWRTFRARYAALLVALMAFMIVFLVDALLVLTLAWVTGKPLASHLLNLVFFLGPFSAGLLLQVLKHVRGEASPKYSTLFAGLRRYEYLVAIGVLLCIPAISPFFVADILLNPELENSGEASGASFVVVAVTFTAIWVVLRLSFAPLLCVDPARQLGVAESLRTSWRLTRHPVVWSLLVLSLTQVLILMGTLLTLLVPMFMFGLPLVLSLWCAAYELLAGDAKDDDATDDAIEEGDRAV